MSASIARASELPGNSSALPEAVRLARLTLASDQQDSLSCWAVAIASKFDLDAVRTPGKAVKFSARYLLYTKTRVDAIRFIVAGEFKRFETILCEKCRNESVFYEQGGTYAESVDAAIEYGLVPEHAYRGFPKDDLYLFRALNALIGEYERNHALARDYDAVAARVDRVMDRHLGKPPKSFVHAGKRYTPVEFRRKLLPNLEQAKAVELEFDAEGGRSREAIQGSQGRTYATYLTPRQQDVMTILASSLRAGAPVLLEYDYVESAHKGSRIGYRVHRLPKHSAKAGGKRELLGHYVLALQAQFDSRGAMKRILVKNTFNLSAREGRGFHWIERDYFQHLIGVEVPDDMVETYRQAGILAEPAVQVSAPAQP